MRAVTWHGTEDVRVDTVPDPSIQEPTDAIVRITSTAICGSDLHLYKILGMFMDEGDIIGHEPMGIVEEVGSEVTDIAPGDRVVVPFNISCGRCWMCHEQLYAQCETTQNREYGKGASLFGYTKLYGHVPGAQVQLLRVPQGPGPRERDLAQPREVPQPHGAVARRRDDETVPDSQRADVDARRRGHEGRLDRAPVHADRQDAAGHRARDQAAVRGEDFTVARDHANPV